MQIQMKLQIKSHSVRFRISDEELEEFVRERKLVSETRVPQADGGTVSLTHEIQYSHAAVNSVLQVSPFAIILVINETDFRELVDSESESVYIRREYAGENGRMVRFVTYVEKDYQKAKHAKV